jgi:hypothetical protein
VRHRDPLVAKALRSAPHLLDPHPDLMLGDAFRDLASHRT